ncbi:hypothetical protein PoHVEF18_001408 [Penicillium ochrochloron]
MASLSFTTSYQIEGAVDEDGRGPSIWDAFCTKPGKIASGHNGDVACDSYHRAEEDIALLKRYGAMAYRFSISWSRVIPFGGRNDPVNEQGLQYYIKLVDNLLAAGITPLIALFHWDLPDELDKRYGGLLNKQEFVADYVNYARVIFNALSPKVKYWITFNEPWCSSVLGYNTGMLAPGRTSDRSKSPEGDGATEPWIVGHNLLVAHGTVVKIFREEYQPLYGGEIGITLNGDWAEPWDPESAADVEACDRRMEFAISWFADPIYFGHYPKTMIAQLGNRLPQWTDKEVALVKDSNDFFGMNHYCSTFVKTEIGKPERTDTVGNVDILLQNKAGEWIGPETQSTWLRPSAIGFRKLLNWLSDRYGQPKIYVTENGTSVKGENDLPLEQALKDDFRVQYFEDYIGAMAEAYTYDKVNVRAYMAWSMMDNFEWAEGYETRFGVTFIDYQNNQKRYPKASATAMSNIFAKYIKNP